MKKYLLAGIVFVSVPFVSFAQTSSTTNTQATGTATTTTIIDSGLLPGDFFYFWIDGLKY